MIVDFESNEDTSDGGKFVGKCSGAVCECARDAKELVKLKNELSVSALRVSSAAGWLQSDGLTMNTSLVDDPSSRMRLRRFPDMHQSSPQS